MPTPDLAPIDDQQPVEVAGAAEGEPSLGDDGYESDLAPATSNTARVAAIAVGVVTAALIVLLAFSGGDEASSQSALVGRRVPAVVGTDVDGGAVDIDDFRGEWVVVNFFATWCPPCVVEHPELVEVERWGQQRGDVSLISVVFNDTDESVRQFFADRGGSWPVISGSTAAVDFQVSQIPETFIIAPNGQVVAHMAGETTANDIQAVIAAAEGDGS